MLHMFISHVSLSLFKQKPWALSRNCSANADPRSAMSSFYSAGDGEWGVLGRGTRFSFGIRGLAVGGEHWTLNDAEQLFYLFWVLTFLFFLNATFQWLFHTNGLFAKCTLY